MPTQECGPKVGWKYPTKSNGKVNPSTSRLKGRGLPFDEFKALSVAEGLEVDPEPHSFTPSSKTGLGAAERVKKNAKT